MARLYKLTLNTPVHRSDPRPPKPMTRDCTIWGPGVTHRAKYRRGEKAKLCTHTVIHAYRHPVQAAVSMCTHGMQNATQLWEARGVVVVEDAYKVGCRQLTTVEPTARYEPSQRLQSLFGLAMHAQLYRHAAVALDKAFDLIVRGVELHTVYVEGGDYIRHALCGLGPGRVSYLPHNLAHVLKACDRVHEALKHTMIQP